VISIKILFFATLRDKTGVRSVLLEAEDNISVANLKNKLIELYPSLLGTIEHCLFSVNREYGLEDTVLTNQSEIAFFPHVSGG
jgi:molybdopterin converting factor subunit 1